MSRLEALLDRASVATFCCEWDTAKTLRTVSSAIESITGYAPAYLIGSSRHGLRKLVHAEDRCQIDAEMQAALDKGCLYEFEYRLCGMDGRIRWVKERGVVQRKNGQSWIDGLLWDIDTRKRRELETQAREMHFRELAHLSCDWFWEQDADLRFSWFSSDAENKLETSPQQFMGQRRWDLPICFVDDAQLAEHRTQLEAHLPFRDFEYALLTVRGEAMWYTVSGHPVFDGAGDFVGYRGVGRNINARKRAERALQGGDAKLAQRIDGCPLSNVDVTARRHADNTAHEDLVRAETLAGLGALVAGVAHVLNTPLGNALLAVSTLAEHSALFERAMATRLSRVALERFVVAVREGCEIAEGSLHRAAELISDFKQLDVDRTSAQRRKFDVAQLAQEIAITMAPQLRKASSVFVNNVAPGVVMDSDPGALGQVLMSLMSNSLVHAFEGRESGEIQLRSDALGADWLRMTYSDNGVGVAPKHIANIFDPFFTTKLGQGGSGLGLYAVHNIVTAVLGGRIAVCSDGCQGLVFCIDVPLSAPGIAVSVLGLDADAQSRPIATQI